MRRIIRDDDVQDLEDGEKKDESEDGVRIIGCSLGQFIRENTSPDPAPRQTEWSQKRAAAGVCFCGKKSFGRTLCPSHLAKQAFRMRLRRRAGRGKR